MGTRAACAGAERLTLPRLSYRGGTIKSEGFTGALATRHRAASVIRLFQLCELSHNHYEASI